MHKQTQRGLIGRRFAYRVIYEVVRGEIQPGLDAHHTCEMPMCVNPWHIELRTRSDHAKAHGLGGGDHQLAKTECPQEHEYTPENTHYTRDGHRKCKACNRERARERREAQEA